MSLFSHDSFWNAVITLPMTKRMLKLSLKKCPVCGRTVLEAALDAYAGKTERKCEKCSGLYSQIIGFWVEFLRRSLNFKREKVEKLLSDPYARRAVMNLAKSFTYMGIKKPISLYAPFLDRLGLHPQMQPAMQTLLLQQRRNPTKKSLPLSRRWQWWTSLRMQGLRRWLFPAANP